MYGSKSPVTRHNPGGNPATSLSAGGHGPSAAGRLAGGEGAVMSRGSGMTLNLGKVQGYFCFGPPGQVSKSPGITTFTSMIRRNATRL